MTRDRSSAMASVVVVAVAIVAPSLFGSAARVAAATSDPCGPIGSRNTELAGCQGTNAVLPATASAVTKGGQGEWSSLQVSVNQTRDLVNQAISVTWTGGKPTTGGQDGASQFDGTFGQNFMQIFQCWGDDDGTGGPPPEQCEYGGEKFGDGGLPNYPLNVPGQIPTRTISKPGWSCNSSTNTLSGCQSYDDLKPQASTDPVADHKRYFLDPQGNIQDPFAPVQGDLVKQSVDHTCCSRPPPWKPFNTNPFFDSITTNELDFARTYPNGTGQEFFQVDTNLEASGLGCGVRTQQRGPGLDFPTCWVVVVPRGGAEENTDGNPGTLVDSSPMTPMVWANRIAFPLTFVPIGESCSVSGNPRRILGGEPAQGAVSSWQPALCSTGAKTAYNYGVLSEGNVRSTITHGSSSAGLGVVTRPIDKQLVDPKKPLTYAPLTLSGAVVGLNIQRVPLHSTQTNGSVDPQEDALQGQRVTRINLTPRLVAKLLTESYLTQFDGRPTPPKGYSWAANNPINIVDDPEFIKYNPEFSVLTQDNNRVTSGGLAVEQPATDTAYLVWQWILADPEAKAWLDGHPDENGMKVNPVYSTDPTLSNGQPLGHPETFPKSDPYCELPAGLPNDGKVGNPPQPARDLCFQDWDPYLLREQDVATAVRVANTGSRTTFDGGATSPNTAWKRDDNQLIGTDFIAGITDSADAARFGLQTASLSRAGDDSDTRNFVAPDAAGLLAGEKAMQRSSADSSVLEPNPSTTSDGAYPLAMLTYAVGAPLGIVDSSGHDDPQARADYANFLTYAAGPGQVSGTSPGQLPPGYVSLPSELTAQTTSAAAAFTNPQLPTTTTTSTTAVTTTSTSTPAHAHTSTTLVAAQSDSQVASVTTGGATTTTTPSPAPPPRSSSHKKPAKHSTGHSPKSNGGSISHGSLRVQAGLPSSAAGPGGATPAISAALGRFALPFTLFVGMIAGILAFVVGPRRRSASRALN